jgi:hypothetical protein
MNQKAKEAKRFTTEFAESTEKEFGAAAGRCKSDVS